MDTNLQGRVRHTRLPKTKGLLPVFEAVVNSIHAIEDASIPLREGTIEVSILRSQQAGLSFDEDSDEAASDQRSEIVGFKITDNGVGFTEANMKAFLTLDTDHKVDRGCLGIGRLLWLKAFDRARIESVYKDELQGGYACRKFSLDATSGVSGEEAQPSDESEARTVVHLSGFDQVYREASRKRIDAIANGLLEHCLWYFVRGGGCPRVLVEDAGQVVNLDAICDEHMHASATAETIDIKGSPFEVMHAKLRWNSLQSHSIAYCAGSRLVKKEKIRGKIPGLYGALKDNDGEFVYACYVTSPYLDDTVRLERTGFDIDENVEGLFAATEISFSDIRDAVLGASREHLGPLLDQNIAKGNERVENFVSTKAPRYRPILKRLEPVERAVDPEIADKPLELILHHHLMQFERELLTDGHDLMKPVAEDEAENYTKRLEDYLGRVEDIKKSDLANYVSHRKVIIDLFAKAIERQEDGGYVREDVIHRLIMPLRRESGDVSSTDANLWLVDEGLTFHDYLASDKPLSSMPISGSKAKKEPDICCLRVDDNSILVSNTDEPPFTSLTILDPNQA